MKSLHSKGVTIPNLGDQYDLNFVYITKTNNVGRRSLTITWNLREENLFVHVLAFGGDVSFGIESGALENLKTIR